MARRGNRPKRDIEFGEYLRFMARATRAIGNRVGEADLQDFDSMLEMRGHLDRALLDVVGDLRQSGYTWEQIGERAGVTRQAALMNWGRKLKVRAAAEQDGAA